MKTKLVISAATCGALLIGSNVFAATSLTVLNPSFESPASPDSIGNSVGQVNGAATSWTGFGFVMQFFPENPNASNYNSLGVLSIPGQGDALGGTQGGTTVSGAGLYQTLGYNYVAGDTYTFSLWVGGSYESPGGTQTIAFTSTETNLGGLLLATNTVDFPNGGNNWIQNTVSYVATPADAGQPIRIILGTTTANGSQTFDLAEVSVPEPSGLMLLGIAGLGLFSLRRRN